MPDIRSFIAIELPGTIQEKLEQVIKDLRSQGTLPIRWVPSRNIHLTLKFLGDVPEEQLESIGQMLGEEAACHQPFEIRISKLGAFPNALKPRVIWLGIEKSTVLGELQQSIEEGTISLGFPRENRRFHPHLTLGRVKRNASHRDIKEISLMLNEQEITNLAVVQVDSVCLFRSDLRPGGAVYSILSTANLQRAKEQRV